MARKHRIIHVSGRSAGGTPHGVLLERDAAGKYALTVTGADGVKRHAASILETVDMDALVSAYLADRDNQGKDK